MNFERTVIVSRNDRRFSIYAVSFSPRECHSRKGVGGGAR